MFRLKSLGFAMHHAFEFSRLNKVTTTVGVQKIVVYDTKVARVKRCSISTRCTASRNDAAAGTRGRRFWFPGNPALGSHFGIGRLPAHVAGDRHVSLPAAVRRKLLQGLTRPSVPVASAAQEGSGPVRDSQRTPEILKGIRRARRLVG